MCHPAHGKLLFCQNATARRSLVRVPTAGRVLIGSLALRPALSLFGNSRPRVITTPLPHATGPYGQLPGRDFTPLDLLLLLRMDLPDYMYGCAARRRTVAARAMASLMRSGWAQSHHVAGRGEEQSLRIEGADSGLATTITLAAPSLVLPTPAGSSPGHVWCAKN